MEIIIKQDNTQKVFLSENTLDVVEILKENYDYIHKSIVDEGFILKYGECNLFKELVHDKKVVGFCSYDFSREFMTASLNNIYVLPEFRGNRILLNELLSTMEDHNKPSIMEPTRLMVELLVKYGFASKINDEIVASALEFVIPGNHVLSNTKYNNDELSTHFYDLTVCRSIHVLDLEKDCFAYSSPLNQDIMNYGGLKDVDDDYIDKVIDFFKNNNDLLMNTVAGLENKLPIKNYTLEEVIGDEDNFSPYIESLIDDAHVTQTKALEIKKQIREEYEAGMVLNESLLIRLAYLFNEDSSPTITSHEDVCPYCSMPVDDHDRYCHFCGVNLDFNPDELEDSLFKSFDSANSEFDEDIRYVAYKFLMLVDEGIEVEYSIFNTVNTFNVSWNVLNSFLSENNYFKDDRITDEGRVFLNNHPLHFWEKYHMDLVDYTDFERYFYEHENSNPIDTCLNYLEQFGDNEYILELIDEIRNK